MSMQQSPRRCQESKLAELVPPFEAEIPKIVFSICEHCPSTESAPEASQTDALLEKTFSLLRRCLASGQNDPEM